MRLQVRMSGRSHHELAVVGSHVDMSLWSHHEHAVVMSQLYDVIERSPKACGGAVTFKYISVISP